VTCCQREETCCQTAKKGEWDMAMGHFALSLSAPFIGGGDGCLYLLPPWGYELLKSPQTLQLDH
jgi:hypothetical protein